MNSILFQPFRLHDLTLPNRIFVEPLVLKQVKIHGREVGGRSLR